MGRAVWSIVIFLVLSVKPLSKSADIWDLKDILSVLVVLLGFGGGGGGIAMNWFGPSTGIIFLLALPAVLFLIAGIKLQWKITPRVKLVYKPDEEPYKTVNEAYTHSGGKLIPSRVRYKVGVQLLGSKATELKVTLLESEPSIPRIPSDLRPSTPNINQSPTLMVYPKHDITDFFEVVSYPWENEGKGEKEIEVALQYGHEYIKRDKYIFTLLVQAKDIPSCKQQFVVEVNGNDELQFYPV